MGSPSPPGDGDRDGHLRYAPPWARDQGGRAGAPPPAAGTGPLAGRAGPGARRDFEPPRPADLDDDPFTDHAGTRPTVDAAAFSPPLRKRVAPQFGMLSRFVLTTVMVAVTVSTMVLMLKTPQKSGLEATSTEARPWAPLRWLLGQQSREPRRQAAQAPTPRPRLTVEDRRGVRNQPMGLGVDLVGVSAGSFIQISGLPPGARLTVGSPVGRDGWKVAAEDFAAAQVVPPDNFTQTMDLLVDLRLADGTIADSNLLRLEWAVTAPTVAATDALPALAPPIRTASSLDAPSAPAAIRPDRDDVGILVARGETLLAMGDVTAARLLLARAAEAGNARGAFALGMTYDPSTLKKFGVLGLVADVDRAREWYQKASMLGSAEAPLRLDQLAQRAR